MLVWAPEADRSWLLPSHGARRYGHFVRCTKSLTASPLPSLHHSDASFPSSLSHSGPTTAASPNPGGGYRRLVTTFFVHIGTVWHLYPLLKNCNPGCRSISPTILLHYGHCQSQPSMCRGSIRNLSRGQSSPIVKAVGIHLINVQPCHTARSEVAF
ncbi:hypothetical protein VTI28DRAFT_5775 [Corynascus sepedonium]